MFKKLKKILTVLKLINDIEIQYDNDNILINCGHRELNVNAPNLSIFVDEHMDSKNPSINNSDIDLEKLKAYKKSMKVVNNQHIQLLEKALFSWLHNDDGFVIKPIRGLMNHYVNEAVRHYIGIIDSNLLHNNDLIDTYTYHTVLKAHEDKIDESLNKLKIEYGIDVLSKHKTLSTDIIEVYLDSKRYFISELGPIHSSLESKKRTNINGKEK